MNNTIIDFKSYVYSLVYQYSNDFIYKNLVDKVLNSYEYWDLEKHGQKTFEEDRCKYFNEFKEKGINILRDKLFLDRCDTVGFNILCENLKDDSLIPNVWYTDNVNEDRWWLDYYLNNQSSDFNIIIPNLYFKCKSKTAMIIEDEILYFITDEVMFNIVKTKKVQLKGFMTGVCDISSEHFYITLRNTLNNYSFDVLCRKDDGEINSYFYDFVDNNVVIETSVMNKKSYFGIYDIKIDKDE